MHRVFYKAKCHNAIINVQSTMGKLSEYSLPAETSGKAICKRRWDLSLDFKKSIGLGKTGHGELCMPNLGVWNLSYMQRKI